MVAYQQFVEFSKSGDSEARGRAAHIAAVAYIAHDGPADEQAALYAAIIGFLDDASVKVRAALAYGLLHAPDAPRPVIISLLHDAPVIARAIAQYSPVLIDADLLGLVDSAETEMLKTIAERPGLSVRVAHALLSRNIKLVSLLVLGQRKLALSPEILAEITDNFGHEAKIRGALLKRKDLPAFCRLTLIDKVNKALRNTRLVKGSIEPKRLDRLMNNATSSALTQIGEAEAHSGESSYAEALLDHDRINPKLMLHAVVSGHVLFFSDCLSLLAEMPRQKVFTLLDRGSRAALNALFARCGFDAPIRNLMARLIFLARTTDLTDDISARHFVVTSLIDELIIEHDGIIPQELASAFAYLNDQNIMLSRLAARGVMSAFAEEADISKRLPIYNQEPILALPAA